MSKKTFRYILLLVLFFSQFAHADCPLNVVGNEAMSMGVLIKEIATDSIILDYQSKRVFSPASVTKALTTATAISTMPANFKFITPVYITGEIKKGTLFGDIVIYGVGDATLESKHFPENLGFCDSIVAKIKELGITKIEGRCRIKNKDFNKDCGVNPNWELEDIAWGYGTGLHSFNYKDNTFTLTLNNSVKTDPLVKDLSVVELPTTGSNGIELMRPFNSNDLFIVGDINKKHGYTNTCSTPFPEDVFIDELTALLENNGITIDNAEIENANELEKTLIHEHSSPPLLNILHSLMVRSDNLFAESTLRAIAKGESLNSAISTELGVWKKRGLNTSFITIRDGSGLSRTNRLSPAFIADMLIYMYNSKYCNAYISCFPRSGKDGTLKNFLKGTKLEGKLAMKTGSMNGVQCYAGYKLDENSKPTHIVVVMVNHFFCQRADLRSAIAKMLLEKL